MSDCTYHIMCAIEVLDDGKRLTRCERRSPLHWGNKICQLGSALWHPFIAFRPIVHSVVISDVSNYCQRSQCVWVVCIILLLAPFLSNGALWYSAWRRGPGSSSRPRRSSFPCSWPHAPLLIMLSLSSLSCPRASSIIATILCPCPCAKSYSTRRVSTSFMFIVGLLRSKKWSRVS